MLDASAYARVAALARECGVTPFMVMQAALAVLLSRLDAGRDIPIGTPVAGRGDAALDDLIGFFVNTLVLRTDVSGDPTFRELLIRVRETDLAAFENQDLPFERLVEIINPPRSMARHPLFQVMLVFQNNERAAYGLSGLTLEEWRDPGTSVAKFDILVSCHEERIADETVLSCTVQGAVDLFNPVSVTELADQLASTLAYLTAAPDQPIHAIEGSLG